MGLALGLAGLFLSMLVAVIRAGPPARPPNVAPGVWEVAAGGEAECLIVLAEQADLSKATTLPGREARLRYVYETLREKALRTQAPVRALLDAAGAEYRSFYVANVLAARADRALIVRLAEHPAVARIAANPRVRQALPEPQPERDRPLAPQAVEWNVARINADDVWAMGYSGTHIVVAGQDTGYDWDHPALIDQYRGYNGVSATHDYNWHDAIHTNSHGYNVCGVDSEEPCDDDDHGTHTMGTMVGDDGAGNQIGVAPGARWIGCRNMDNRYGTPTTYIECFEFFLAPYPVGGDPLTQGDPTKAPHVVNNSWVCPPSEGCDWGTLQTIVENVRAAGIVVVASAGNQGSSCSTVRYPPAIYDAAFSVGATDSGDNIASFSSRGPVTVDGSGRPKPDVSAPGVNVRSSVPGDGYEAGWNGTSMAGPHVAGTVALLWSAAPCLAGDVDATEAIIRQAARPFTTTQGCGGDGSSDIPNNVYGWGIVDALAAVEMAQAGLEVAKQAAFPMGLPARSLWYTLRITNTSCLTLSQVVLTDSVPVSTTFAWASGIYTHAGGVVTWAPTSLASGEMLTATMGVTVAHLPRGTRVVNDEYGVRASELSTPVAGVPVEAIVPWRYILFPVFREWPAAGE